MLLERSLRGSTHRRPVPPLMTSAFLPAPEVLEWARAVFIDESGPLFNPEHLHLAQAKLGILWAGVEMNRKGMRVAGLAEIPSVIGHPWLKARMECQLGEWFGEVPDFVITLDASECASAADSPFCALVEHEMLHCGQAKDEYGSPRYRRDGSPVFAIRGHDVEEFVAIVERYGPLGVLNPAVARMVDAAQRSTAIRADRLGLACGTCLGA